MADFRKTGSINMAETYAQSIFHTRLPIRLL